MANYTNRLPIDFGEQGMACLIKGYEAPQLDQGSVFEYCGQWLELADFPLNDNAQSMHVDPLDIQAQVIPHLIKQLRFVLGKLGQTSIIDNAVHYAGKSGKARIDVFLDLHEKQYWLKVIPEEAHNKYAVIEECMGILSGSKLSENIHIGSWKAIHPPKISFPTLIFSEDGIQHHNNAADGLNAFGPFGRKNSRNRKVNILVLCREENQDSMSEFIQNLAEGIPKPSKVAAIWGLGMKSQFQLKEVNFHAIVVQAYGQEDLRPTIEKKLEQFSAQEETIDLIIYEYDETYRNLEVFCLQKGLPPHRLCKQDFKLHSIQRADFLRSLALMLYVKLGEVPWLLPLPKTMDHQFVVGVGTLPAEKGIVGYTTIFGSHGNYRLGNAKWNTNIQAWREDLAEFILNEITKLKRKDRWSSGVSIKITFHLDTSLDFDAQQKLRSTLNDHLGAEFNLKIAFIVLKEQHDFEMWNDAHDQIKMVDPGIQLYISESLALLQMTKKNEFLDPQKPILIEFLSGSDTVDRDFSLRQIFHFASLAWDSTNRAPLPATLLYGQKIAMKGNALIRENHQLTIPEKLQMTPWYL